MTNLSGKTFEVQTFDEDRWTTFELHFGRTPALEQAQTLVDSGKYTAVQVLSDSDRTGTEVIFEYSVDGDEDKPMSALPVDTSPLCENLIDYYKLPARHTLGRVLRTYLDHHVYSALELLFDRSRLVSLERNETLYAQTMQQVASAQARVLSVKPAERLEILYEAAARISDQALAFTDKDEGLKVLKGKGIEALLRWARSQGDDDKSFLCVRHAIAGLLREGGDWNNKIELVVALGIEGLSEDAVSVIDEVLAELLDGAMAMSELLAGQADGFQANRALIRLSEGRLEPPVNPVSCIVAFNDLMGRYVMPLTRSVLFARVAKYVGSTRKLTREGPKAERDAFARLLRDLVDMSGIKGGVPLCESLTQRARIALSEQDDLSTEEAVLKITDMLPSRASRIGYLLELFQTDEGARHERVVLSAMGRTLKQMSSLSALVPEGSSEAVVSEAIEGLKQKMMSEGLPAEWRDTLTSTFDTLMARPQKTAYSRTTKPISDEEFKEIVKKAPEHKRINEGEILFEEGDNGLEAYLILSGHVEIYRRIGNREEVIATVGRGDIIGEMSLIDNQARMASARVLESGQVSVIDQLNFGSRLDRLGESDKVLRRLIDVMVNRIRGEGRSYP